VVAGVTAGSFDLKAFARQARFDQDRARILPDAFTRASEELASSQAAPADDEGVSLQYASGGLVAGLDARRVFGRSQETLHPAPLSPAAVIARNASGGAAARGGLRRGGRLAARLAAPAGRVAVRSLAQPRRHSPRAARFGRAPRHGPSRPQRSIARAAPRAALRTRTNLTLENLALRQQLALLRHGSKRPRFGRLDRLLWVWLSSADGPGGEMRCISFAPRP